MTKFTKEEQWANDYDFFIVDSKGKIGRLCHFGWRLLPPTIATSVENLETVENYFLNLSKSTTFTKCPELLNNLDKTTIDDFARYVNYFGELSSKGLYSYDSYNDTYDKRPYFRVTIPAKELTLDELPDEIKDILSELRLNEISFAETSLIPEEIVSRL